MMYNSTTDKNLRVSAAQAIAQGISEDGGLFVPSEIPKYSEKDMKDLLKMDYRGRAKKILRDYLSGFTAEEVDWCVEKAYTKEKFGSDNPAPLVYLEQGEAKFNMLELWHGPTCAFKDMALQMLPHLLTASLQKTGENREACILVATSGDTGKAALEGFRDVPGTRILVFYPKDGVSDIQRLQMTTQRGGNVGVCAVYGNFDDAQTGVKAIFSDEKLRERLDRAGLFFSSANSINFGRVLPQIVYYISAYCDLVTDGAVRFGDKINVAVPTGNFGNILSAYYAMKMGLPVNRLICASNRNNVLTDFFSTGRYDAERPFFNTLSPSMDILVSSNLERLLYDVSGGDAVYVKRLMGMLNEERSYPVSNEIREKLGGLFWAGSCDDPTTESVIGSVFRRYGTLVDPHTAVAFRVNGLYRRETGDVTPSLVVSTASPFKFCPGVLRALGRDGKGAPGASLITRLEELSGLKAPAPLKELESLPERFTEAAACGDMAEYVTKTLGL